MEKIEIKELMAGNDDETLWVSIGFSSELEELDDQDVASGMDGIYLERFDQAYSCYKGASQILVEHNSILIQLNKQCNEDKKEIILPLLKACNDWVKDDIILHAKKLGDESLSQMNELINEYDDYLCGIEVGGKKNIIIRTTCGSSGEEFLIKMMETFAPHATKMNGNFEHDEEYEPPVKYRLQDESIIKL